MIENILDKKQFIKHQNDFIEYYQINKYLEAKTTKYGETTKIDTKILNSIDLELFVLNELKKVNSYLSSDLLDNMHNLLLKEEKDFFINKNMFKYIVIKKYLENIKRIYNKNLENIENTGDASNKVYQIKCFRQLPKKIDINTENKKDISIDSHAENKFKYAYVPLNDQYHYFDSEAEIVFVKSMKRFLNDNNGSVKLWTKNPLASKISFDYFIDDAYSDFSSSYPDFIFEIDKNNKKKHFLYVEIKNLSDLIPQKTIKIIESYKKYIQYWNESFVQSDCEISLVVCYVSNKHNEDKFYIIGASSNKDFDKQINKDLPEDFDIRTEINTNPKKYPAFEEFSKAINEILKYN